MKGRDGRCTDEMEQNEELSGGNSQGLVFYKGLGIAVSSLMRVQHRKKQSGLQAWAKARFPLSYCTPVQIAATVNQLEARLESLLQERKTARQCPVTDDGSWTPTAGLACRLFPAPLVLVGSRLRLGSGQI